MEILGVLDRATGKFRLRAIDPRPATSQGEWFKQILAHMPIWVDKGSKILADHSIDRECLRAMGYTDIVQDRRTAGSNANILDYLKKIVPKMFQVKQDL